MTEWRHRAHWPHPHTPVGSWVWTALTLIGLALLIATILVAHTYSPTS